MEEKILSLKSCLTATGIYYFLEIRVKLLHIHLHNIDVHLLLHSYSSSFSTIITGKSSLGSLASHIISAEEGEEMLGILLDTKSEDLRVT